MELKHLIEVIDLYSFDSLKLAKEKEVELLSMYNLVNTGILPNGNTETYKLL